MKKHFLFLAAFCSAFFGAIAQTYIPVATTGYNLDGVAENTTAISTTGGALDNSDFIIYTQYYGTLYGGGAVGIPNNGTIVNGSRTYQLPNYNGPNALRVNSFLKDSLTFTNPQAFPSISLLSFATQGNATMSVTVRFTDNTTQVFSSIYLDDWFNANTAVISGYDRATRSTGALAYVGSAGNPRMFATDLAISCANQGKPIKRVVIYNNSSAIAVVMAVSGAVPAYSVNAPAVICGGSSATLSASGFATYTWQPVGSFAGSNASSIIDSPAGATSYTLQGTDNSGCPGYTVVTVNVSNSLPTLSLTGSSSSVCLGAAATITVSGAQTYTLGSPAANGGTFALSSTTTYTMAGANACGTSTAATTISVVALPNVTGSSSTPSLCSGSSLTLTGVGTATAYTWFGSATTITNGVGFNPVTSTNYTVVGTAATGCTAAATVSVPVVQTPSIAPIALPAIVCLGNSASLTASGATGYTWTGGASVGSNSVYVVTPSAPGLSTYTVLRVNSTCTTTAQISIVTNSLPVAFAIVSGPTLVCASNAVTLAVAGGQTYTWTSPGNPPITPSFTFTGANPVVFPPVNTVYTVAAHDGTCINTTTVAVGTNPNPTLLPTVSSTMICAGQTVSLSVTGGNNYTWTAAPSTTTFNTASFTDTPSQPTSYNVTGDNNFGCTSNTGVVVVVNAAPTVSATAVLNKTLTCNGGTLALTAGGTHTYSWSNGASGNTVVVTPTNVVSGPVVYTVTGTNTITQCSGTKTIAVNVFIPVLTVSGNTIACIGGPISLNATGGSNTWVWETPGNPPVPGFSSLNTTISAAAVFTVSAKTNSLAVSCPGSATVAVDVYPNPSITAVAQRTTICFKESVILTAGGGTAYAWSNGKQTTTISVSPGTNTTYTVTGTDLNGCSNTNTVSVKVLACTGISELNANTSLITIYPNPNIGEFTVQSDVEARLNVVNELGQLIRTITLTSASNYKAEVRDLSPGVYFISGERDGKILNQKIVVTR